MKDANHISLNRTKTSVHLPTDPLPGSPVLPHTPRGLPCPSFFQDTKSLQWPLHFREHTHRSENDEHLCEEPRVTYQLLVETGVTAWPSRSGRPSECTCPSEHTRPSECTTPQSARASQSTHASQSAHASASALTTGFRKPCHPLKWHILPWPHGSQIDIPGSREKQ